MIDRTSTGNSVGTKGEARSEPKPLDMAGVVERLEADYAACDRPQTVRVAVRKDDLRALLSAFKARGEANDRLKEALEPSGDTKAAYHGEFKFQVTQWRESEDEESEDEMEAYLADFTVPWTTVKEIMAAIKARTALTQTQGDDQ